MGRELTQFKKGFTSWNKGKHSSEETRKKISKAFKGRKLSEEHKKKIGLNGYHYGMKGKKHSVETRERMSESHKGVKSHLWLGGITDLGKQIRGSYKYRLWRCDVFTRDGYTCQECGRTGGEMNADHVTPFAVVLKKNEISKLEQALECEELWNINNGRTLCVPCHKKTESYLNRWSKQFKQPQQLSPAMVAAGQNTQQNVTSFQQNGR